MHQRQTVSRFAPARDLAGRLRLALIGRDAVTMNEVQRLALENLGARSGAEIGRAMQSIGFARGFLRTAKPHPLLGFGELGLHQAVTDWTANRPACTLADLLICNPDLPRCGPARAEIRWQLGRLGYRPAWLR